MAKRNDLTISVELPDGHNADRLSIAPDGSVKVFDKSGNEIKLEKVARAMHYERPKGPKHQSLSETQGQSVSVGGLDELSQLSSFVAIDTNTEEINGIKVSAAVREGKPHEEICEAAKAMGADLIVLTTHGYTGLKHVWLGSTAERVVRHAPCPVLVVRELSRK